MKYIYIAIILLIFTNLVSSTNIYCYNDDNKKVDWWIILKVPYIKDISTGYEYFYYDNNTLDKIFTLHNGSLNDTINPLYFTLKQLNDNYGDKNIGYYLYNDEPYPNSITYLYPLLVYDYTYGHTKGVVQFDKNGGYFLTHSVPRFPQTPNLKYYYPENEIEYGQSMMCLSIGIDQIDIIGKQLRYTKPNIFSYNLPNEYNLPETKLMINKIWYVYPMTSIDTFITINKLNITSVTKTWNTGLDLYEDIVAEALNNDLYVESWQREGKLPNYEKPCYKYEIINVMNIKFDDTYTYTSTKDHSKYAISENNNIVCISDMNRDTGQRVRGGGCICFQHDNLHNSFRNIISF